MGVGVVPVEPGSVHAPPWVLVACGAVFVLGGVAMLTYDRPRIQSAAGGTIVLAFGLVAGWVALFGEAAQFSGGLPFVSRGLNVAIARGMFGLGSVLCFVLFVWGTSKMLRGEA